MEGGRQGGKVGLLGLSGQRGEASHAHAHAQSHCTDIDTAAPGRAWDEDVDKGTLQGLDWACARGQEATHAHVCATCRHGLRTALGGPHSPGMKMLMRAPCRDLGMSFSGSEQSSEACMQQHKR